MNLIRQMSDYVLNADDNSFYEYYKEFPKEELLCTVSSILSWLKLEYKRTVWISEGRKASLKPMRIELKYSWCQVLIQMLLKPGMLSDYFEIVEGNIQFKASVYEEMRKEMRQTAFEVYNPVENDYIPIK